MPCEIRTPRLLLRQTRETDLELYQRIYTDEETLRYSPFDVMDRETVALRVRDILREWALPAPLNRELTVVRLADGARLGRCHIEYDPETDTAMIGFHLLREARRQGYASEIAPALIDYSFHTLGVHRVNALCNPENEGSRRVLTACGMRLEAHFRKKCRYVKHGETDWRDELQYALLKEEWR